MAVVLFLLAVSLAGIACANGLAPARGAAKVAAASTIGADACSAVSLLART